MQKLLIINGYAGSGKSTAAKSFAKRNDFALLQQDTLLFQFNAFREEKGGLTASEHSVAVRNMHDCALNYMRIKRNIVIEGALVSISKKDPLDIRDFIKLAKRMRYKVIIVTFIADKKTRLKREKKRRYIVPKNIDKKLQKAINDVCGKIDGEIIVDTTKLSKRKTLEILEGVV